MEVQVGFLNPAFKAHHCCTFSETARSQPEKKISSLQHLNPGKLYLAGIHFSVVHSSVPEIKFSAILAAP